MYDGGASRIEEDWINMKTSLNEPKTGTRRRGDCVFKV